MSALEINPKNSVALSRSQIKQKVGFNFSSPVNSSSKKASIKVISENPSLIKVKPALIKLKPNKLTGELEPSEVSFLVKKSLFSQLLEDESVTISLEPNAQALALGIEPASFEASVIVGETVSVPVETVFGGKPVLPSTDTSLSARVIPVAAEIRNSVEPGLATLLNYPANAGSCALGLGGEPLSTTVGPGGSAGAGALRYGSGTEDDPLYVVFNNPNNGGEEEELTAPALPLELFEAGPVAAFAQIYEGAGATGTVISTVTGTAELDTDNQEINLTTEDGVIISYSKSGSKDISLPQELSDFIGGLGVSLNQALGFLEGAALPITVPEEEIEAQIKAGIEDQGSDDSDFGPDGDATVDLSSDLTGTLSLSGNRMNGSFGASGVVSFDITGLGTQTLSGTNNIQMTISSDNPALVSGFELRNATGSISISGGSGFIQSITADFVINSANISVASGITAADVTITNTSLVTDDSFLPDDGDGGDEEGTPYEQCIQQCLELGGDESTCAAACVDLQ